MIAKSVSLLYILACLIGPTWLHNGRNLMHDQGTSILPEKLKGLKSVLLGSYVDPHIPHNFDLEKLIEATIGKMLVDADISLDNSQVGTYFITVTLWPVDNPELSEYALVQVQTELIEEVRLLRKGSVKKPVSAVTWQTGSVSIWRRADVEACALKEAEEQGNFFLSSLKSVKR